MGDLEVTWARVCNVLEGMTTAPKRRRDRILGSLIDDAWACGDSFSVLRILVPERDKDRAHFQLKETSLAQCLMYALGLAPNSRDGRRLLNWKTSAGSMSGDLSRLACQVISARQKEQPGNLSLSDVHNYFDKLSSGKLREEKVSVLKDLIKHTTAEQMKWVVRLILRDLRIGVGENTVLDVFHPDAKNMMSFCVDLKQVCGRLASRTVRYHCQDLEVGKPSKCQHTKRVNSIDEAWNLMEGKRMVAECKFDGDRIQVHKDGDKLWFWSRNNVEHPEYQASIGALLQQQIKSKKCILDGELLVWDCTEGRYKSRTHNLNHDTARATRKGWETDDLICYVVFDIIYEENCGSLIHLPLQDRQELLKEIVTEDQPRIITVLPGDNVSQWSIEPKDQENLNKFFMDVVQRGDEGIVIKDLGSQYSPDNRDGRWLKVKPDYVNLGTDLDLLIIGGYYGSGQGAGQIVSYLLAVKAQSKSEVGPPNFLTICRCGTGLSRDEQNDLQQTLMPYAVKNKNLNIPPPDSGYLISGSPFERPDFWISHPKMSKVLQVSSERRVYSSFTFKAGYTFRFSRAIKVRYDKNWMDILSLQEFKDMVAVAKVCGKSTVGMSKSLPLPSTKKKYGRTGSGTLIPVHLQGRDYSDIIKKSSIFENLVIFICKPMESELVEDLRKRIHENGGKVFRSLLKKVTHVVSAGTRGLDFKTAVKSGRDVINTDWLEECIRSSQLLPINFRHYLYLSDATKESQRAEVDNYGDSYFESTTSEDLEKIFQNMDTHNFEVDMNYLLKVEQKYFGSSAWSIFRGMVLFLLPPIHSTNIDSQTIAQCTLQRLSLEASMYGASVVETLHESVTHSICFVPKSIHIPFKSIYRSIQGSGQHETLLCKNVHVVSHLWLQDTIQQKEILSVSDYNLRSDALLDAAFVTKEEPSPKKRRRVSETPPESSSRRESLQDSVEDFLRILLPSLESCT
ncbi:hypothetical protein M758_5G112000 [Ceratodon purpureus]|nr:hypothetical protein M758_5G112000 [Ceratodon purpureus]